MTLGFTCILDVKSQFSHCILVCFTRKSKCEVEGELSAKCREVLKILFEELIPKAGNAEAKVFYLKMKGRGRDSRL